MPRFSVSSVTEYSIRKTLKTHMSGFCQKQVTDAYHHQNMQLLRLLLGLPCLRGGLPVFREEMCTFACTNYKINNTDGIKILNTSFCCTINSTQTRRLWHYTCRLAGSGCLIQLLLKMFIFFFFSLCRGRQRRSHSGETVGLQAHLMAAQLM